MSYEKQTWQNGDTITAEKLNHMEDGIADSSGDANASKVFIADVTATKNGNDWVCSTETTFADLANAYNNGKLPFVNLVVAYNDGRPEDYYDRVCLTLSSFIPTATIGFSHIEVNNQLTIARNFSCTFLPNGNVTFRLSE